MNEETSAEGWSELHLMRQRLASLEERHAAEIATLKSGWSSCGSARF